MYIYLLSCIGEKVATQLKQELFRSIMKQDIAFFDCQRTGELVNRYLKHLQYILCVCVCVCVFSELIKGGHARNAIHGHGGLYQVNTGIAGSESASGLDV
jgi:DeoR/GlpR family transcriptional regulator of sugar metabolism